MICVGGTLPCCTALLFASCWNWNIGRNPIMGYPSDVRKWSKWLRSAYVSFLYDN
uniref:Uncharacterized protein n=1 Tax=Arundo donax TaxID=35708 RepID=A0A0A8ZL21_ARUDO